MSKQWTQTGQLGKAIGRKEQRQLAHWFENGIGMADERWTLVVVGRAFVLYPCRIEGVENDNERNTGPANLLGGWNNNG